MWSPSARVDTKVGHQLHAHTPDQRRQEHVQLVTVLWPGFFPLCILIDARGAVSVHQILRPHRGYVVPVRRVAHSQGEGHDSEAADAALWQVQAEVEGAVDVDGCAMYALLGDGLGVSRCNMQAWPCLTDPRSFSPPHALRHGSTASTRT